MELEGAHRHGHRSYIERGAQPAYSWIAPRARRLPWAMSSTPASSSASSGLSVTGFQSLIRERYFATDSARGSAVTFLLFMEEVGELATSLHENRPGKTPTTEQRANLEEEFADVLAWLATLANITGVDLERALGKYTKPGRVEGVKD